MHREASAERGLRVRDLRLQGVGGGVVHHDQARRLHTGKPQWNFSQRVGQFAISNEYALRRFRSVHELRPRLGH